MANFLLLIFGILFTGIGIFSIFSAVNVFTYIIPGGAADFLDGFSVSFGMMLLLAYYVRRYKEQNTSR
ncbi:hypothetical protein [Rufibacter sp. LB8]|uniref:hypothetical protein n=1 Tax=Rufibacter sp. LB8 TaxID=2777781 RepID=UPI00178C2843|nr:hypothetical protein [Rufibacter sp. LB8]